MDEAPVKVVLSIEQMAGLCTKWISQDMDFFLALTGIKGGGKTTMSLQLARHYWRQKFGGEMDDFKIADHIVFSHEDFKRLTDTLPDGSPIIIDEACNLMMGEDWNVGASRELKKDVITLRTRHFLLIGNMPDLWWFDRKYRDNMITYWAHVYNRGYCALFAPSLVPGTEDRWFREYFKKLRRHWTYFTDRHQIEKDLLKHPGFQDFVTFVNLPKDIYDKYLIVRADSLAKRKESTIDNGRMSRNTARKWVHIVAGSVAGVKAGELAVKYDISLADVYNVLREANLTIEEKKVMQDNRKKKA